MSQSEKDLLVLNGTVLEAFPDCIFKVQVKLPSSTETYTATCYSSGRLRKNRVRIKEGDQVEIEFNKTDVTRGRVVRRIDKPKV